ncbi:hypothetical protein PBRA_004714 [Plasmodiophora brassicae]|uniref:Uncharacterized protein n=1 Tax=Plasmodiophora brassicae TaxID=37360 RepID=A0A0G4ILH8_PLABS|nr:hypothetical protein PBRA_004714 [Plasmodiophora brassicae]
MNTSSVGSPQHQSKKPTTTLETIFRRVHLFKTNGRVHLLLLQKDDAALSSIDIALMAKSTMKIWSAAFGDVLAFTDTSTAVTTTGVRL